MVKKSGIARDVFAFEVPIVKWSACWGSREHDLSVHVHDLLARVPSTLRRRLSPFAKSVLGAALHCLQMQTAVACVYASRHGELSRTTAMLADMAENVPVSPAGFSLSVLNATLGLLSIVRQDRSPSVAVSAGVESFGYGLLEAFLQWCHNPHEPVLFIYADEPAPELYGLEEAADYGAIAVLLGSDSSLCLSCRVIDGDGTAGDGTLAQGFLDCLAGTVTQSSWQGEHRSWTWQR